jgi:Lon protease-like protein
MSDLLPLFPLPSVVLFPNVFLPLHIFEPRYREMVTDALASDRLIGMVLLRPGWERSYEGRPPVYPIGCSGVITHAERLHDGCYDIVLRGLDRFRIVDEDDTRAYRRATVEPLPDKAMGGDQRRVIHECRTKLEGMLGTDPRISDARIPSAMSDEDLINALAQYLDFEPLEKQALLEKPCLRSRAQSLVELLEMKTLMARTPWASHVAH